MGPVTLILLSLLGLSFGQFRLEFVRHHHPPAQIPDRNEDMKFSVPANRSWNNDVEIIVKLVLDDGSLVTTPTPVVMTTVLAANWPTVTVTDTYPGMICDVSYRTPGSPYERWFWVLQICDETKKTSSTPHGSVTLNTKSNGEASFHRMLHTHATENGNRVLVFSATINGVTKTLASNPIEVTHRAKRLELVEQPPSTIESNTPMNFSVRTIAARNDGTEFYLTHGMDATLTVDLGVAWYWKYFFSKPGSVYRGVSSPLLTLAGNGVFETAQGDLIMRRRAVNGTAEFQDVRILEEFSDIKLNFTMSKPEFDWRRVDDDYADTQQFASVPGTQYLQLPLNTNSSLSELITDAFDVIGQTAANITLDASTIANWDPIADSNFLLNRPCTVTITDANGNTVTGGADSKATIQTVLDPPEACLSTDSSFTASYGEGEFTGSICDPIDVVRLKFYMTNKDGDRVETDWSPNLNVTGIIHVASLAAHMANHDTFARLGVEDLNNGVNWTLNGVNYFENRTVTLERHDSKADIQTTLEIYQDIRENLKTLGRPKVRAIIGPGRNDILEELSLISQQDDIPIIAHNSPTDAVSDKAVHPLVARICQNDEDASYGIIKWHLTHLWTKIIVIQSQAQTLPSVFYRVAKELGLTIEIDVEIPVVNSAAELAVQPPLDEKTINLIKNANTRIIYCVLDGPTLHLAMREAIASKFSSYHGYQWTGTKAGLFSFPLGNQVGHCRANYPYCTIAFTGTNFVFDTYDVSYAEPIWKHIYYNFLTRDPVYWHGAITPYIALGIGLAALPYEAVVAYGQAIQMGIRDKLTLTGRTTFRLLQQVRYHGITGNVIINEKGNRPGFRAAMLNINAKLDQRAVADPNYIYNIGSEIYTDTKESPLVETIIGYITYYRINVGAAYSNTTYKNLRTYLSVNDDGDLVNKTERVPAAHYCQDGCGGGIADSSSVYYYGHGTCVAIDECQCKNKPSSTDPGYAGSDCSQILCNPSCRNGRCVSPDNCACDSRWAGNDCGTALCNPACVYGTCVAPDVCRCAPKTFGRDCARKCTCKNGICNEGVSGDGHCTSCNSLYTGSDCETNVLTIALPTVFGGIVLIAIIVFVARWYIKRLRTQAALINMDWRVNHDDIMYDSAGGAAKSSIMFRSLMSMKSEAGGNKEKIVLKNSGKWNGIAVAIKEIDKPGVDLSMDIRWELKTVRELRHQNVVHFVGACIDAPNVCILSELVLKGSLDDILANEDVNVEWNFRYSLLKDITRGMQYLHKSELSSHGRLKSSNCIVDNRWTCKISDYGLIKFKSSQVNVPPRGVSKLEDSETGDAIGPFWSQLLWTAPELLQNGVTHPNHIEAGTKEGDMYSFGIIMAEMATREAPFAEVEGFEMEDIIAFIAGTKAPPKQAWVKSNVQAGTGHFRPSVTVEDVDPEYCSLMKQCWDEDSLNRPTFLSVLKTLDRINPLQGELVDNLINMLEKYSTNLEGIVAERTSELHAEKQKTEELICRMLPKAIADELKQGRTVAAESFECVTIYFSDIVGFTSIAGQSTPLQVVDLLNDLYTCFDSIIDNFDVYKVETIGDAYMVVSGLPNRNGDRHAGEIATMSMYLLSAMATFRIRHIPDRQLQLRIGMHSGPCVAGVVGLKMPRYCLFGDTVNTASRMESGGLALRIHMSDPTAQILQKLGGYQLECRGEREVKGKGMMKTWWLLNKDGFTHKLPSLNVAASESQHEFK